MTGGDDIRIERLRERRDRELSQVAGEPRAGGRALCLSGGGYRAALFHLGTLLRLHERGLLHGVELLSSVSGGSIVSAWIACCHLRQRRDPDEDFARWCRRIDFRAAVVEPFRAVVRRDIRSLAVLATLPVNWALPSPRVALLQRAYARVFGDIALQDLPATPRFVFCATNLTFGVNWEFSNERVGDYLSGYLRDPPRLPLALAVAASSSFPPVFGPLRFRAGAGDFVRGGYDGDDADPLRERIELSDGGLYDNLGMEPALRRYGEVLVSDAGAPFPFVAGRHWLRRLLRYTEVIGNQAVVLRRRLFFAARAQQAFTGSYWSLGGRSDAGADGYSPGLVADTIAQVRTDLDRFDAAEFEVLVNHGYFSCEDGLRAGPAAAAAPAWPYPAFADEARVRAALHASHRRLWPPRWWRRDTR